MTEFEKRLIEVMEALCKTTIAMLMARMDRLEQRLDDEKADKRLVVLEQKDGSRSWIEKVVIATLITLLGGAMFALLLKAK